MNFDFNRTKKDLFYMYIRLFINIPLDAHQFAQESD